jgi:hypothetical protein
VSRNIHDWQTEAFNRSRALGGVLVEPAPLIFPSIPQIVFTHLPKTAGLTLRAILAMVCAVKGWTFEPLLGAATLTGGAPDAYKACAPWKLRTARFIWGHIPFGLHDPAVPHMVLVRDPAERAISQYVMAVTRGVFPMGTSPEVLYRSGQLPDNLQTRMLSGLPEMLDHDARCTTDVFERALHNLLNVYMIVASVADFDDFLAVLLAMIDAPSMMYFQRNVSSIDLPEDIEASVRGAAERHCEFDTELVKALHGRIRLRHPMIGERAAQPGDCIAFKDESAREYIYHRHGPAAHIKVLRQQGVPVRRHALKTPKLLFV